MKQYTAEEIAEYLDALLKEQGEIQRALADLATGIDALRFKLDATDRSIDALTLWVKKAFAGTRKKTGD